MTANSLSKLPFPWRITFDTNPGICNLHCIMCEEHSEYNAKKNSFQLMDFNVLKKIIESSKKSDLKEIIPSTMGEPLLYPHFEQLLVLIKKNNLKLNLTTNGTFPFFGPEKWGLKILPLASDIKISINGITKSTSESIMKGINFENQISSIIKFVKLRNEMFSTRNSYPTITFQVTFMEKNLEELPELLEFAISLGVNRVKGHHLWVIWPQLENQSLLRNNKAKIKWNIMVEKLYKIANKKKLPNGQKIVLDNIYKIPNIVNKDKKNPLPENWICPFIGKEAWISSDGTFNVCCIPDNLRKNLGYYGNVNQKDFVSLWNSEKYMKLVEEWKSYEVCKNCLMRRPMVK